ncbi:MAG: DedA family protein [Candidatus Gracilibacteria bacterium]|nr:DedA family protein [Candidatus Gracilibacteria bacterium]
MLVKLIDYLMKFLIFLTIALGIISLIKPEWAKAFIDWIQAIINNLGNWNYVIVFLSGLIESFPILGVVVPGQNVLLIVGGFFAKINQTNLIYVITIASIGAIISNYIGYVLGVYYGDTFFKKYGNWFGIGLTEVKYLKKGIKKWGPAGITLGKFHNLTRAFLPFIAGSMGMNSKSFFIYNCIGSIIRAITIVVLGVLFASYYEIIIDYMIYIMIGVTLLVSFYIYKFKKKEFMDYVKEKNEELDSTFN